MTDGLPLVFSASVPLASVRYIAEEIQISSFLGIIFAYDALVVVLLLVWLVMSSTFSSFSFYHWYII
jgi:hypothetical protein